MHSLYGFPLNIISIPQPGRSASPSPTTWAFLAAASCCFRIPAAYAYSRDFPALLSLTTSTIGLLGSSDFHWSACSFSSSEIDTFGAGSDGNSGSGSFASAYSLSRLLPASTNLMFAASFISCCTLLSWSASISTVTSRYTLHPVRLTLSSSRFFSFACEFF